MRILLVGLMTLTAVACSSKTKAPSDVPATNGKDAAPISAPEGGTNSRIGQVPCNDGSGAVDCCTGAVLDGGCPPEGAECWTKCTFGSGQGFRSAITCSGGVRSTGHGLIPCSRTTE